VIIRRLKRGWGRIKTAGHSQAQRIGPPHWQKAEVPRSTTSGATGWPCRANLSRPRDCPLTVALSCRPGRSGLHFACRASARHSLRHDRGSTHPGPWLRTLLIVVLTGRAVIRVRLPSYLHTGRDPVLWVFSPQNRRSLSAL